MRHGLKEAASDRTRTGAAASSVVVLGVALAAFLVWSGGASALAPPCRSQDATIGVAAQLAQASYSSAAAVGDWQAVGGQCGSAFGGFHSCLYVNPSSGQAVLAFRGSDDPADWVLTNVPNALGDVGVQYVQAQQAALDARDYAEAHGLSLVVTGHSLGGGLAQSISCLQGIPAITFNPAAPATWISSAYPCDGDEITNVVTVGDPLAAWNTVTDAVGTLGLTGTHQLGQTLVASYPTTILGAHDLDPLVAYVCTGAELVALPPGLDRVATLGRIAELAGTSVQAGVTTAVGNTVEASRWIGKTVGGWLKAAVDSVGEKTIEVNEVEVASACDLTSSVAAGTCEPEALAKTLASSIDGVAASELGTGGSARPGGVGGDAAQKEGMSLAAVLESLVGATATISAGPLTGSPLGPVSSLTWMDVTVTDALFNDVVLLAAMMSPVTLAAIEVVACETTGVVCSEAVIDAALALAASRGRGIGEHPVIDEPAEMVAVLQEASEQVGITEEAVQALQAVLADVVLVATLPTSVEGVAALYEPVLEAFLAAVGVEERPVWEKPVHERDLGGKGVTIRPFGDLF